MMKLAKEELRQIVKSSQQVIGFWGAPSEESLQKAQDLFPDLPFYDLDVYRSAPRVGIVPDAYCHVLRNCVDNAVALGPLLTCVVAATGREKCDGGRYAAHVVEAHTKAKVFVTTNEKLAATAQPLLCSAKGSLKKRAVRIMESIVEPLSEKERTTAFMSQCEATCGFWGTPPHPIEVLDLFPETTHIFGWTRCVEQNRPADGALELNAPEGIPTVFFAQGFCQKSLLAKQLAEKHGGLFVDVHDSMGAALVAKIEAYLRLSQQ